MAVAVDPRKPRPFEEIREMMLERARINRNPFIHTKFEEVESAFRRLHSADRDEWAAALSDLAEPYERKAAEAEAAGDAQGAKSNYLMAHYYYEVARFPIPKSAGKMRAYRRAQENYLKAARYFDPPLEQVSIPFAGRPGEGSAIPAHLRKPRGVERPPVVVVWGGIDRFKESRTGDEYLNEGLASLVIDMPGVGDSPLVGSEDAERLWNPIFDWIAGRANLDSSRVAVVGASMGGYWATKLAHTHRQRIRAAVNHGGPVHYAFTAEWIAKAQFGEYPFEFAETAASAFGRSTFDELVEYGPRLSLLNQGVLDQVGAPLLLINGIHDTVFPIADMYLLLEHGYPKTARFFPVGHMGNTPETIPTILRFLHQYLDSH